MRKNIVFLDRSTFPSNILFQKLDFNYTWKNYSFTKISEVRKRIQKAHIIVTNKIELNRNNLSGAKNLELIALTATGTNIIDLNYCKKNNISVCNLKDYASVSVAEHVLTLMLSLSKNIKGLERDIGNKLWQKRKVFALLSREINDLHGKTLGIIGKGSIGLKVGRLSRAFGMKIRYFSVRNYKKNQFLKFLSSLDYLSIHCPLTNKTKNLITIKELKKMKKNLILINTARGGIVSEIDLTKALKQKIIAGAGIDVTTSEPPKKSHPYYSILNEANFIWTPHTAWASNETLQEAINQLVKNINFFYKGKKRNIV
jgi:glycerate dehydrogenase